MSVRRIVGLLVASAALTAASASASNFGFRRAPPSFEWGSLWGQVAPEEWEQNVSEAGRDSASRFRARYHVPLHWLAAADGGHAVLHRELLVDAKSADAAELSLRPEGSSDLSWSVVSGESDPAELVRELDGAITRVESSLLQMGGGITLEVEFDLPAGLPPGEYMILCIAALPPESNRDEGGRPLARFTCISAESIRVR